MGVNINISGVKVSGNAKVLNNMTVDGKSNVNVGVRNSQIIQNAEVLNDLNMKNGELEVEVEGVTLGKDAKFMNNRIVTREEKSNEETKPEEETRTEKESVLGKILSKVLGKAVQPDQILKPVELEQVQSAKAKRMAFASDLGNGTIVVDEKAAIKKAEEQGKEKETKVRDNEQKSM